MNIRNSEGVISAWETGVSVLYAWVNPVAQGMQALVELNLRTCSAMYGEAFKTLGASVRTCDSASSPGAQSNVAAGLTGLFSVYGNELAGIASQFNDALQNAARAQAEKSEILMRSFAEATHSQVNEASAAALSALQVALSKAPTLESIARQAADDAIAAARALPSTSGDTPRKAAIG